MAKITFSGTIQTIVENQNAKSIVVETEPGKPGSAGKPATPGKRVQITTTDHKNLDGIQRGKPVKITIEQ